MAFIQFDFLSHSLMRTVPVTAVIPADYTSFIGSRIPPAQPPYKTLYLLHGIYNNEKDWVLHTNVERLSRERGIALIMPAGENRFYTDDAEGIFAYGEYIGRELVDVTRRMFHLSDKREDTFIGGYSMGGYGAIMNGLRYRDTFSRVIGLSPVIARKALAENLAEVPPINQEVFRNSLFGKNDLDKDDQHNPMRLVEKLISEGKALPEFYISVGTEDPLVIDGCREFDACLQRENIHYIYKEKPGGHNYAFWNEAIQDGLDWLPQGEKIAATGHA